MEERDQNKQDKSNLEETDTVQGVFKNIFCFQRDKKTFVYPWTETKTGYHQKTFQDLERALDIKDMIVEFFFFKSIKALENQVKETT